MIQPGHNWIAFPFQNSKFGAGEPVSFEIKNCGLRTIKLKQNFMHFLPLVKISGHLIILNKVYHAVNNIVASYTAFTYLGNMWIYCLLVTLYMY